MKTLWSGLMMLVSMMAGAAEVTSPAPAGKVLVVLSSESKITLQGGVAHPTGFFLPELMGPARALHEAGYELVFANPQGTPAVMDKVSDSDFWTGNVPGADSAQVARASDEYRELRDLCREWGLCGAPGELTGNRRLTRLADIVRDGLDQYAAVFFPGGHAPMEDLWQDPAVRATLRAFHSAGKPTGLICHAPVALLAALDNPRAYTEALVRDDRGAMVAASRNWIYRGYTMTVFTTREERQEEPGQDNALGGFVRFYADAALERAGGYVQRADKWQSQVVVDRELITGQNPFSHRAFAEALLKALRAR